MQMRCFSMREIFSLPTRNKKTDKTTEKCIKFLKVPRFLRGTLTVFHRTPCKFKGNSIYFEGYEKVDVSVKGKADIEVL
jgi:hypothetical protein